MKLTTFAPNLKRDPTLPSGLWDPLWQKPEVATRVALETYLHLRCTFPDFGPDALVPAADLPTFPPRNTEERTFALGDVKTFEDSSTCFRGGSYGEIYRRYTYGQTKPAVNFHAQAVVFGVDSEGRYFLKGSLGRVDGGWGNRASLCLRFVAAGAPVGGVLFEAELDPPQDVPFSLAGSSPALAAAFPKLEAARLSFFSKSD